MAKVVLVPDEHKANYKTISTKVFEDRKLTMEAKGLFGFLIGRPPDWETEVRGNLKTFFREKQDALEAALLDLKQHGYVYGAVKRDQAGRILDHAYFVFETPLPWEQAGEQARAKGWQLHLPVESPQTRGGKTQRLGFSRAINNKVFNKNKRKETTTSVFLDIPGQGQLSWDECRQIALETLTACLERYFTHEYPKVIGQPCRARDVEMAALPARLNAVIKGYQEHNPAGLGFAEYVVYHFNCVKAIAERKEQDHVEARWLGAPSTFAAMDEFWKIGNYEDDEYEGSITPSEARQAWTEGMRRRTRRRWPRGGIRGT